jgi:hypothetical protein
MRDDAINAAPVERNRTIELTEQSGTMVSQELSTDTAALLALREDVVARHTSG